MHKIIICVGLAMLVSGCDLIEEDALMSQPPVHHYHPTESGHRPVTSNVHHHSGPVNTNTATHHHGRTPNSASQIVVSSPAKQKSGQVVTVPSNPRHSHTIVTGHSKQAVKQNKAKTAKKDKNHNHSRQPS